MYSKGEDAHYVRPELADKMKRQGTGDVEAPMGAREARRFQAKMERRELASRARKSEGFVKRKHKKRRKNNGKKRGSGPGR